jgi:hypothetical protein
MVNSFIAHPDTVLDLSQLKVLEGSNQPLLGPDATSPTKRSVLGVPVYTSPAVDEDLIWAIPKLKSFVVIRDGATPSCPTPAPSSHLTEPRFAARLGSSSPGRTPQPSSRSQSAAADRTAPTAESIPFSGSARLGRNRMAGAGLSLGARTQRARPPTRAGEGFAATYLGRGPFDAKTLLPDSQLLHTQSGTHTDGGPRAHPLGLAGALRRWGGRVQNGGAAGSRGQTARCTVTTTSQTSSGLGTNRCTTNHDHERAYSGLLKYGWSNGRAGAGCGSEPGPSSSDIRG